MGKKRPLLNIELRKPPIAMIIYSDQTLLDTSLTSELWAPMMVIKTYYYDFES